MKKRLTKNGGLKLLSLAVAFIVWLLVINISNPKVRRTKTVEIEVLNEDAVTKKSRVYEIRGGNKVNVSYDVRILDENKIKSSDFRAYVDCNKLYEDTNSLYVVVEVVDNKELIIGSPSASPGVINLDIETIQQKKFDLISHAEGTPGEGYSVGEIKLDPSSITLTGPENVFGSISNVGIEVNVDGAVSDLSGEAVPVLYDANGNRLETDTSKLKFSMEGIHYNVTILGGKTLPLNFNVGGNVASGYKFIGVESATKSVQVTGPPAELEKLSSIEIPQNVLNIEGATEDKSVVLDVNEYLPAGVSASGSKDVMITLKVAAINRKTFELKLSDIRLNGKNSAYTYATSPEVITLVVSGLETELAKLKASDINAVMNISGLTEGTHTGSLAFKPSGSLAVESYTPFNVIVTARDETQPAQTSSESSGSDSQGGSSSQNPSESAYQGETSQPATSATRESTTHRSEPSSKTETPAPSQTVPPRETSSKPETQTRRESGSKTEP